MNREDLPAGDLLYSFFCLISLSKKNKNRTAAEEVAAHSSFPPPALILYGERLPRFLRTIIPFNSFSTKRKRKKNRIRLLAAYLYIKGTFQYVSVHYPQQQLSYYARNLIAELAALPARET